MNDLVKTLKQSFRDKDYRHGYVDEFLHAGIATQIKVLREQRIWTQKELADRAEMLQPRISAIENVNYSSWSIKMLRKIAEAFDLTLRVSFESFGTRVGDIEKFSRNNLERPSFNEDPYFQEECQEAAIKRKSEEYSELPVQEASETLFHIEDYRGDLSSQQETHPHAAGATR